MWEINAEISSASDSDLSSFSPVHSSTTSLGNRHWDCCILLTNTNPRSTDIERISLQVDHILGKQSEILVADEAFDLEPRSLWTH